jgi:hypothetical protein
MVVTSVLSPRPNATARDDVCLTERETAGSQKISSRSAEWAVGVASRDALVGDVNAGGAEFASELVFPRTT